MDDDTPNDRDAQRGADARHDGAAQHSAPEPSPGWHVLHLFCSLGPGTDRHAIELAVKECESAGHQVVAAAMLGHKSDLGILALGPSAATLRVLQSALQLAGCRVEYSYVSLTEVSEYAKGVPAAMREARLHPSLPPADMPAFCFYPMSKRRAPDANWYALDYDARLELMHGHGAIGRTFRGRVLQLVTGSTGLDDWEWGVTLFGRSADDLKDCVYTMRFDEASARYADFGPFLSGSVGALGDVLAALGLPGGAP